MMLLMCGYSISFIFYWRNPLFNCGNILDNRTTVVADCDKTCPYVTPTPTPSPSPSKDNGGTDDQDDYETDVA